MPASRIPMISGDSLYQSDQAHGGFTIIYFGERASFKLFASRRAAKAIGQNLLPGGKVMLYAATLLGITSAIIHFSLFHVTDRIVGRVGRPAR
jgi:hypothetical protein